jgi:hypothetical protein
MQRLQVNRQENSDTAATVFHEDDDEGRHQEFTARMVAERLAEVLELRVMAVVLSVGVIDAEWNFHDIGVPGGPCNRMQAVRVGNRD